MHIQIVTFHLKGITDAQYAQACREQFAPLFEAMPGLISKVWLRNPATNTYGGVYKWQDKAAMDTYVGSELFRTVQAHPNFADVTSRDFGVLEDIVTGAR